MEEREPVPICISCGNPDTEGHTHCPVCKVPLGNFASTAPWELSASKSTFGQAQTDPRLKPIVFWGVWLYFGPTVILAAILAISAIRELARKASHDFFGEVVLLLLALTYASLGGWALWSVTKRCLSQDKD